MNLGLAGKVALVTGGSHGIGRSIALALAEEGCRVAIGARTEVRVKETVEEIKNIGSRGLGVVGNLTEKLGVEKMLETTLEEFGSLHILVNNMGGGGRWGGDEAENEPEDTWRDVYNKNTVAATRFTTLAIPVMMSQGWGRVVTISSTNGIKGTGKPWFSVAKAAQIALMRSLAADRRFIRAGITFNTVAPGPVMIPDTGWDQARKDDPVGFEKMLMERFPMGRIGTPEEVAWAVVFLCSTKASLINGVCLIADGGETRVF